MKFSFLFAYFVQ
uniref:Uncharacterized protein n=1 Tax=Arundo donax TaxID=35708 RepID=A0A0A9H359_ARUDO